MVNSIVDRTKLLSQIINLIIDIVTLARNFRNTQFNYLSRNANRLADVIATKAHRIVNGLYYSFNE